MSNSTNFRDLKTFLILFLLTVPVWLYLGNGCKLEKSISQYANVIPMLFAFLLTLAGTVIFNDGFVERKRWYNMITGVGLFGVVLFKNTLYPTLHYSFAGLFFLTPVFVMIWLSFKEAKLIIRLSLRILAFLVLFGMAGHFIFKWYSLFFAEWIGIIPISTLIYLIIRYNRIFHLKIKLKPI